MTTLIVIAVIVLVVLAVVGYVIRKKNRETNMARADELRAQAASQAQGNLPPAQDRAAEAETKAEQARLAAERATAEAEEARLAASHAEAEHEASVRAADRLDPRVNHKAGDYAPQVGGTADQQPVAPSEANRAPEPTPATDAPAPEQPTTEQPTTEQPATDAPGSDPQGTPGTPLLPRRTPGANDMPGKPIESDGTSGGWFTRKDS